MEISLTITGLRSSRAGCRLSQMINNDRLNDRPVRRSQGTFSSFSLNLVLRRESAWDEKQRQGFSQCRFARLTGSDALRLAEAGDGDCRFRGASKGLDFDRARFVTSEFLGEIDGD
jgi:hypothetical protein